MSGQFVGPYRVVDKLGSGGMGDVYLAEDTRLGRRVALKKPSAEWLALPSARARLHREASAAAVLTHPHIAGIYDVIDDGTAPYIVMEYVEGDSLATLLAAGRISVERAVAIGIQLADALAAAHAKGIVHRDLKPGNVCLTPEGQAKVLDFGLASARMPSSGASAAAQKLTVPGQFLGTPGYASPEQLAGSVGSPSDDLYSLGVLLFELLTGRRPFEADHVLDLAVATMTRTAPPAERFNPAVPPALSALVARALARNPQDRVPSAAHFGSALRDIAEALAGSPTRALPSRQRRRQQTVVVTTTSLLGVAAIAAGLWLTRLATPVETTGVPVVAVLPFTHSDRPEDQAIASGLRDVLIADLARRPGLNVLSRAATAESRGDRADLGKWSRDLGATYLVDGSLQRVGDQLQVVVYLLRQDSRYPEWTGRFSGTAEKVFNLQERVADALARDSALHEAAGQASGAPSAGTRDAVAFGLYGQAGDFLERPDIPGNVERAIKLLESSLARDSRFALAWARLGEARWARYEDTRDPAWTQGAIAAVDEAVRLDPEQPLVRLSRARVHFGTGHPAEALEELTKAVARQPNSDDVHRLLGHVFQSAGRTDEAAAAYQRAIELRPAYWRNHNFLGGLHLSAGRHREALAAFTRVTELQPDNARGFHNTAIVYYHMGEHDSALTYYEKAIALSPNASMPDSYSGAGAIYYQQGRYEDAAKAFAAAIEQSPNEGLHHGNLGDALTRLNRRSDAQSAYAEAVRLDLQVLTVNPHDPAILSRLAVYEAKLGRKADAERHAVQALELSGNDGEILYRVAVVHALNGNMDSALARLEEALGRGYSSAIARTDHDLSFIRETARFQALIGTR